MGDSIFDNKTYVPAGMAVTDHLSVLLPASWSATLLAVDGSKAADLLPQIAALPAGTTVAVLSIGGNDALECLGLLGEPVANVAQALQSLCANQARFKQEYEICVAQILKHNVPLVLCTIYDSVPGLTPDLKTALSLFNDVIVRQGVKRGLQIIDLREVCAVAADYSPVSPIEPSSEGGQKIAQAIWNAMNARDAADGVCRIAG